MEEVDGVKLSHNERMRFRVSSVFADMGYPYCIPGKVGGKKIWRIVPPLNIAGFYFGDRLKGHYNYIHNLWIIRWLQ